MKNHILVPVTACWVLFFTFLTIQPSSGQQGGGSESGFSQTGDAIYWWPLESSTGSFVMDEGQQKKDSLYGNFEFVPGVSGHAMKLDGFRTYIRRNPEKSDIPSGPFTLESWIALASYPWSWSPMIDCSYPEIKGFFFGIDPEGHVGLKIAAGTMWYEAISKEKISLRTWTHVAAVFEPDKRISLFIDGEKTASIEISGNYVPSRYGTLTIGRNNTPQTWNEFQLTTPNSYFFLDGILDEIKISGKAKTEEEIRSVYSALKDLPVPALTHREQLPLGPEGSGSFGAFYTRLNYYKEWDDLWRVSDVPDLYVRFDQSPVQLVFWRGTSFVPCWVTENGIWYLNEWLETWGSDVESCAEPIMDRQCRYSHVRLIENTEARVVIHWRYALSDTFYDFVAVGDDGRGEWCDEFHTIYPDQVGVRKMELHYSRPERKHDWVEQIVILPPGKYPDDVIDQNAVSLINMEGQVQKYSWQDDIQVEMPEPEGANMSYVHLKSEYKPFFIVSPDPVETVEGTWDSPFFRTYASHMATGYRQDPAPSVYGWWNHWPVAQVPGDGRWVITPDRPSHFNLTTFVQWKDYEYTERTRTRIMLQGMTDGDADELVPLANSWLRAPEMKIRSEAYGGGSYDASERAYLVEKTDSDRVTPLKIEVEASRDSPLLNPALIVKNWGDHKAALFVDGKPIPTGEDFRQGIRKGPLGDDLIIWIRMEREKPVDITLERSEN